MEAAEKQPAGLEEVAETGREGGDVEAGGPAGPGAPRAGQPRPFGSRPAVFRSTAHEVAFVLQATAAVMTTSFLAGTSSVVTASVGRDLDMTQGQVSWISAASWLAAGSFQPALGQLADLLGRKTLYLVGTALFAGFGALAGSARNPVWMDVVCGLLGLCSAMVVPPAVGILGAAYSASSRRKNLAFAAFSAGNPLGFVLGSVLTGVAASIFGNSWRAGYYLLAIIWGALAIAAVWTVPNVETGTLDAVAGGGVAAAQQQQQQVMSLKQKLARFARHFDSVGAILTLVGTGLFTAGLT